MNPSPAPADPLHRDHTEEAISERLKAATAHSYLGDFIEDKSGPTPVEQVSKVLLKSQVDKLLDEHNETFSEAKRHEQMKNALKIVYDQALITSATALTQAVGTHKRVKGLRSYFRTLAANEVWLA